MRKTQKVRQEIVEATAKAMEQVNETFRLAAEEMDRRVASMKLKLEPRRRSGELRAVTR